MDGADMKVITISGKAGAGKDTFAGFLKTELEKDGSRVLIAHYGDLVKYIAKTFLGWDGKKDENGRRLLQILGTDVIRDKDPQYWVRFLVEIFRWMPIWDYVLIPDARFENEITDMRSRFSTVSMVVKRDFESSLNAEARAHISENALAGFPFDVVVHNSGTLEELKEAAAVAAKIVGDEDVQIEINRSVS